MLPIRATKGKGEMEICQTDQSVKGFQSEMTWIHFGAKVMFAEVQGAFLNYELITSADMLLLCQEMPQSKR